VFSAYRPPAFGVGGFADKFNSLHSYGLAVDLTGIGSPGSRQSKLWHRIAARHGVICPYGPSNRVEWNHCQPTRVKMVVRGNPLRRTITARGPIDLEVMWRVAGRVIGGVKGAAERVVAGAAKAVTPKPAQATKVAKAKKPAKRVKLAKVKKRKHGHVRVARHVPRHERARAVRQKVITQEEWLRM
jgi:hypothetical protein